jgi:hypothetical protein
MKLNQTKMYIKSKIINSDDGKEIIQQHEINLHD